MKALIIYMSTHGTTEKIVDRLSNLLGYNTSTIINLKNQKVPDLKNFDTIIIGGSVHAGKIQRKVRKYCESNLPILLEKQLGLFMCYMDTKNEIQEFEDSFPQELIDHAKAKGYFGGEFVFEKMNFVEKFMARKVSGMSKTVSRINSQAINHFAIQITG
ncbi:MAG: flavodoxin domain-containing protein [Balneolaceae bacterium]